MGGRIECIGICLVTGIPMQKNLHPLVCSSYPCRRFARHVKEPWVYVEVEITGKIDRPFLARNSVFR